MQVVALLEYDREAAGLRAALLDRIAALALTGAARLVFAAAPMAGDNAGRCGLIAAVFRDRATAQAALADWGGAFAIRIRQLDIEPQDPQEGLALIFP